MPKVSESTQASTCPPGRRTRAISATSDSAARCRDSVPSSAMTPSAQPSARNSSPQPSAATERSTPRLGARGRGAAGGGAAGWAGGGWGPGPMTRSTVWPAQAATSAAVAPGPDMSMMRACLLGSQALSCARATAARNRA
jgi:hypothetical protein